MQKTGILGGGQLGKMLLQAAANYPVETYVLENDPACPAAHLSNYFIKGDIRDFDDVYNFGKNLDAVTIEIESVNVEALLRLEEEGVKIYPRPSTLGIVKNKILQKQYYQTYSIPTAKFVITQNRKELEDNAHFLPGVHKVALGGYDGRGVVTLKSKDHFANGFDEPAILEKVVSIKKEISVIVAISERGEVAIYPPIEMIFNKDFNLLEYQLSPAQLEEQTTWKAEAIALTVVKNFKSPGIFAVEMFLDTSNNVLVNETAPRVHNSGHHTIEANYSSQFDMLWRIILGYPLGNTDHIVGAAIVNMIGEENYSGPATYDGLEKVLEIDNAFVHIYGKKETRPGRKMGHVTILSNERQELIHTSLKIKSLLKVISS
ncbi:MAG: 5-(carboxyamino)imidazole ribonucleotide synthase [Ginsengibacter sp.]